MSQLHHEIIRTFAEWTALSALRSGAPVKSADAIYPALRRVPFDELFDESRGAIAPEEFDVWHRSAVAQLDGTLRCGAGWGAKLVNVYLKTRAYVARDGRSGLAEVLHPPVDGGLWRGLERRFGRDSEVCRLTHRATLIRELRTYGDYEAVISGCRLAAQQLDCALIEIEQLWEGTRVRIAP